MKNILLCLLVLFSLASCNKYYYVATTDNDIDLFSEAKYTYRELTIPAGSTIILNKKPKKAAYRKVKYNEYEGYIYNKVVFKEVKRAGLFSKSDAFVYYHKNPKPTNVYEQGKLYKRPFPSTSEYTPSGGGRVNVKGYTRKDGTYVRPHTRSAPKRH